VKVKKKKVKSKELHRILAESNSALEHWFEESEKYEPAHIASDRIKSEINRLSILQNRIRLKLERRRANRVRWYIFITLVLLFFSFLQKPKLLFQLTLNNTLLLAIIAAIMTIGGPIIHLIGTRHDREAKRKYDSAQAVYASSQTKLVKSQLKDKDSDKK